MREDILDRHKLAAKADKIWQLSSARSVNVLSAVSLMLPELEFFILILWMSSLPFLLQLPLTRSVPISSRLPEKSGNYYQSIQLFSLSTVFQLLLLYMECSQPSHCSWYSCFHQSLPDPGKLASPQAELFRLGLFDVLPLYGPALFTWFLSMMMVPARYPLPTIADFSARIAGFKFFSNLNLQKGYFPTHPTNIPKTTLITPFGFFKFLQLPFGFRNTAQTFQRIMYRIFGDLPFCFVY